MQFTLTLTTEHTNIVLAGLNKLEHGQARATFDHILQQVQRQEAASQLEAKSNQAAGHRLD